MRGGRAGAVVVLVLALATGALPAAGPAAAAPGGGLGRPEVPEQRDSDVRTVTGLGAKQARDAVTAHLADNKASARRAAAERHADWPTAGRAALTLPAGRARKAATVAGGLPVTVASSGEAEAAVGSGSVRVLDRAATTAAGVRGVLLTAAAERPGRARLTVGYGAFASAYGGGWSGRLGLTRLPACALTTPEKPGCRTGTPLTTRNDTAAQTVSAEVPLGAAAGGATVLALAAVSPASATGAGTYAATPLSSSSAWQAGGSAGSFTWSYPMSVPPAAAGPAPALQLAYDSGAIDGRTASTNNQTTQVGEGFDLSTSSYVERSYGSCDQDGQNDKHDLCWKYENASLVLNGKSSELVKDDTTGTWRLADDDASTVTHLTGGTGGDGDGEYWTVTTGDGTRYWFGLDKLPGAGTERTDSVWTVPVHGDDSGEPGYDQGSSFADRSVVQAWRWNLDYVEDPSGNAASYWYIKETNAYGKNEAEKATTEYTRGGRLDKILYGQRKDSLFTGVTSNKVTFTYAERCTAADCSELTESKAPNWPDVPFDAICKKDADCDAHSPAFFTRKRLTQVDTWSWSAAISAFTPVDTWAFTQEYLDGGDIGDSTDQTLTLKSIRRTGKNGTALTLDPITFTYQMRENRVDATDNILPLSRPRIESVTSETGSITRVSLSQPECVRGSAMPAAEDDNTRSCYPQYWGINGAAESTLDWFHKYRVLAVTVSDPTGKNDATQTSYTYADPAWRYNDSPLVALDERTWSVWRGYGRVTTVKGAGASAVKTVTVYRQGMDGDRLLGPDGKLDPDARRSADVTGIGFTGLPVPAQTDSDQYAGMVRQQVSYNGTTPVSVTVDEPWSKRTATQHKSYADTEAYFVRTAKSSTHTHLTATGGWRTTATATTYDDFGMAATVDTTGDTVRSGDETCTRTWYARNAAAGINSLVSRTRTVGRSCSVTENSLSLPASSGTRGDVLSDIATVYDRPSATAWSADQTPTKGWKTWGGRASAYPATTTDGERPPTAWQTTGGSAFDDLGRVTTSTDAAGQSTTVAYTPVAAGPLTRMVLTNPKSQKSYTYHDPGSGQVTKVYDLNTRLTETSYDALGRTTAVWLPNRSRSGKQSANYVYGYSVGNDKPSWTSSGSLKADGDTYSTSYTVYDSLLRTLQTQAPTALGGRLLTDTRYDSRGLTHETYADIFDADHTPDGTYTRAEYGEAPKQTSTVFDAAGRPVGTTQYVYGDKHWSTTTSYTGDSTATTALSGGSAVREITDALGRVVERREYAGTATTDTAYGGTAGAPYTSTGFTFTADGKESTVTGPDRTVWKYGYDLYGRQVSATDPDKGTTTTGWTAADQVAKVTDARGTSLLYEYDVLGRRTGEWSGAKTDPNKLTAWSYDTLAKGQLDSTTRYQGGVAGTAYTKKVTAYDALYRATGNQLVLPADDPLVTSGAVKSTIGFSTYYNLDGTQQYIDEPAAGGLAAEKVEASFNDVGLPTALSGKSGYVLGASYSALGESNQLTLGTSAATGVKKAYLTQTWEEGTGRLTRSVLTDQTHAYELQELNYTYDDSGNVTSVKDPTTLGGTSSVDNQCFGYDGHRRLTEAWTPANGDCAATSSSSVLGGPSPYRTSYTYTDAGLRATETDHTATTAKTRTYCYSSTQPHALTATTTAASCTGVTAAYAYDAAGNTRTRPDGTATQTLSWSPEGKLGEVKEGTSVTGYVYDADGNLLVRRNAAGETVLYLGTTEVHLDTTTGKFWAQRYYGFDGNAVALRTNKSGTDTLCWLAADHHGTSSVAMDATTQAVTKRYSTPFGVPRTGGSGTWPDDKAFLGKTADAATGLTHVGAREYDPLTGRFISVDPLLETDKQQTLNGYTYAANNPVTFSDPTGNAVPECMTGEIKCRGGIPVSNSKDAGSGGKKGNGSGGGGGGGNGSGGGGHTVVRNGGQSNVGSSCGLTFAMSGHNAAVCQSGYAVQVWAMEYEVEGYVTVDIGDGGTTANTVPSASGNNTGNDGAADVILWTKDKVYIWEVKPGNTYGKTDGPKDLTRYVEGMQDYFDDVGDDREVERGQGLLPGKAASREGLMNVWSKADYPGMRFYGRSDRRKPTPKPGPLPKPSAGSEQPVEEPAPGTVDAPMPEPVPGATGSATGSKSGNGGFEISPQGQKAGAGAAVFAGVLFTIGFFVNGLTGGALA
ncbi:RHS repeat-associated core domain-containing protein [Streptomyces beigongshangae]|uniref:RHS repeat-associated core domain-containing protein n=1 Tax=Streptomyces beigongshangae TaxID=2841597 RepID=UPI001C853441|nr:RHS repeat-associated core domain-containing protein [Streptomyces sp. REN17]